MRTVRTKVYKFGELSEKAKKEAIAWYREYVQYDHEYWTIFNEDAKEQIEEEGFDSPEIKYSFSYSQGDGFSFSATSMDLERFISEALPACSPQRRKELIDNIYYNIEGNTGRYPFADKNDIKIYCRSDDKILNGYFEIVKDYIQEKYLAICKRLEDQGYAEIEYRNGDEYISEQLRANEYEFTKEGKKFNY